MDFAGEHVCPNCKHRNVPSRQAWCDCTKSEKRCARVQHFLDRWGELRHTLEMRRWQMQQKVEAAESAPVHKCAVLTFDYVLEEMARLDREESA